MNYTETNHPGFTFQNPAIASNDLAVYNARNIPFRSHGLYKPETPGLFRRMPEEAASKVSEKVLRLSTNPAGARLRFQTDSDYIAVGAIYPPIEYVSPCSAALSNAGAFCFDLYTDDQFRSVLHPTTVIQDGNIPRFHIEGNQFEAAYNLGSQKKRTITLHFPSFVNISQVYVGVRNGSMLEPSEPYRNEKPVVFYGSSITQGACASRPGNIYQNILSRRLHFDYLNLGFSGSAKAEDAIIDYLCTLDMCMLVFDYDHNASSPENLEKTHYPALRKLRTAHPDIPILLLSRPNLCGGKEQVLQRIAVIEKSYRKLKELGDEKLHFINGQEILASYDSEMVTLDDTHTTDFGFLCMAEAIQKVMSLYFPA